MAAVLFVSPCLIGLATRWNGKAGTDASEVTARFLAQGGRIVSLCPECSGGLSVPRPPCEIRGEGGGSSVLLGRAKVVSDRGEDCTAEYLSGARDALALCLQNGVKTALLKSRSPSCGAGAIYDGTFSGNRIPGDGVTAALFRQAGIQVFGEEQAIEAVSAALSGTQRKCC